MISKITLKKVATFDEEGSALDNLKKISFIYGENGSGKTTLSNYLLDRNNQEYQNCEINWKNNTPLECLVYNKKFRESIFSSADIKGIFTLGESAPETVERLKQINSELEKNKVDYISHSNTLNQKKTELLTKDEEFTNTCWQTIYKKYENDFKEVLRGNIGKQTVFRDSLLDKYNKDKDLTAKTYADLRETAQKIFKETTEKYEDLQSTPDFSEIKTIGNKIFQKKIIGKNDVDIATLISKLNNSDWVNTGRKYLQTGGICPFCQQKTITDEFIGKLNLFFDETYETDISVLNTVSEKYREITNLMLNYFDGIEKSESTNKNSQLNKIIFSALLKTLHSQVSENMEKINAKQKEPSIIVEPILHDEIVKQLNDILKDARNKIKEHNKFVDNIEVEKTTLRDNVWCFFVQENKVQIEGYLNARKGINNAIDNIQKYLDKSRENKNTLEAEEKELNKTNVSVEATIDAINDTLEQFGFIGFKIVHSNKPNFYSLQRSNGDLAKDSLSEGEITFICFLYYMQLVHGSNKEDGLESDKVLIIDDPISSLDSNILFIVSTMIKEEIKKTKKTELNKIKQIIILTHNIYFFKEITFIDGRSEKESDVGYWIIRKDLNRSTFISYDDKCPIVSSYDLLWNELKEFKAGEKVSCIAIQNVMRRIIEHYFKLLGKYKDDSLLEKFTNKQEKGLARSLLVWINDGSHSLTDDLFIECSPTMIDAYFSIFKKIFENTDQLSHYNMMMGIKDE